jgi:exoribonuclease-2
MNQGKIIEYIEAGKFVCTLCLEDKGNRLHLLTPSNREVNLSPKRAILISGPTIDILRPREELLETLKQTDGTRVGLKGQINVRELWELIKGEKESFDHKYLAQLVFGEEVTGDHLSALVRALFEDHLYFKLKDSQFLPNSEEKVDHIVKQREEEALKEDILKQGGLWLRNIRDGKKPVIPPFKERIINLLERLALYGSEEADYKYGKELLSRAGIFDIHEARNLLIMLGVWEEDENLDLRRSGIDTAFTERQLADSARLADSEIDFQGREDLRDLPALTIDGPLTRDYDDAVSLEMAGDILHLGIHIADVTAVISPESTLDHAARDRASSLYLARRQIPMTPPSLSQDTLSLKQGLDRQAISLLARFDKSGNLLDHRFIPSVIRIQRQLTYEEVDKSLDKEGLLQETYKISQQLRKKRMDQGALHLSLPDLHVSFNADSSVSLELVDQNTPSRIVVAECMILYNWLAARLCRDNQIPILYRTQSEPNQTFSMGEAGYLYYVFKQRRKLSPLRIDTEPSPHTGLGLDVYTHVSSPIRRYLDLVVQRQVKGFLMGMGPVYDKDKLEEIRLVVEPVIRNLEMIKRNRLRYWTIKFITQHLDEKYKALVVDELRGKYRIVLTDFLLIAEIRRQNGIILIPGQEILVKVEKADPWDNILELEYFSE